MEGSVWRVDLFDLMVLEVFKTFLSKESLVFSYLFSKAKILFTPSNTIKLLQIFSVTPKFSSQVMHTFCGIIQLLPTPQKIFFLYILNSKSGIWINHSFLTFTKELYFLWLFCLHQHYPYIYMVPSTHFSKNIWSHSSKISNQIQFKFGPEVIFLPQTISKLHQNSWPPGKLIFE